MKNAAKLLSAMLAALTVGWSSSHVRAAETYYTGEQVYSLRPKPENHKDMDHIGPTGILAFVDVGVKVIIEGARKGSPADGKVQRGPDG